MNPYTKSLINILKETIRCFKKYSGFASTGNDFYIDKEKLYFQTPYYTVQLKMPLLDNSINRSNVIKLCADDMIGMADTLHEGSYIRYNNVRRNAEYVSGPFWNVGIAGESEPIHNLLTHKRHGKRIYKLLACDIPHIKTGLEFVNRFYEHDGSYTSARNRNIYLSSRVYATDDFFGYVSDVLTTKVPEGVKTFIPRAISNIIKHSDRDIIVRESDSDIEFENEYFNIFYNKPYTRHFPTTSFHADFVDQVTVDKTELVNSLKYLKSTFKTVRASKQQIDVDLTISVNGSFIVKSRSSTVYSSQVESFNKTFTEDLNFNTYGNRFLKILSIIKGDTVNLKIPRGSSGGVLVNDTYLLMSFMEWI
jgi:hypothetical protein